jgi:hypothetical protein
MSSFFLATNQDLSESGASLGSAFVRGLLGPSPVVARNSKTEFIRLSPVSPKKLSALRRMAPSQ